MVALSPLRRITVALERSPYDVVIGDGGLRRIVGRNSWRASARDAGSGDQ